MRKQANVLDGIADSSSQLNRVPLLDRSSVHLNFPLRRCKQAINHLQTSSLPRPAAAKQRQGLAPAHGNAHAGEQHLASSDAKLHIPELDRDGGRVVHLIRPAIAATAYQSRGSVGAGADPEWL